MHKFFALLAAAALTALNLAATARADTYSELLSLSGIGDAARQFRQQVNDGLGQSGQKAQNLTVEQRQKLNAIISRSFDPDAMVGQAEATLRQQLNPADAAEILAWHHSPLGDRVTTAERTALSPEFPAAVAEYAQGHGASISPERKSKLQDLDRAVRSTDRLISMMMNTTMAMAASMNSAQGRDDRGLGDIRSKLTQTFESQRAMMTESVLSMYAYMYRDLSDAELDQYTAFYRSPLGQRYADAASASIEAAFSKGFAEMGQTMATASGKTNACPVRPTAQPAAAGLTSC